MIRLQLLSKRIHRLLAFVAACLGAIMMLTGLNMKYSWFETLVDYSYSSYVHNLTSTYFAVILSAMAVTGLFMFLFPYWQKWDNRRKLAAGK